MAISVLFKEALAAPLKSNGFSKKSNNWYWNNEEVILIVNLQKTQYGDQYYVNCAVALKSFGAEGFPKEHFSDIRFRLASVVPEEKRDKCNAVFDLENGFYTEDTRKAAATSFFEKYGLSLLMECKGVASIADAYKTGRLPEWTVSKKVADFINQSGQ
jgi:hypothetical protein